MSFGEAIRTCFRKYVDFNGRARRSEFWYWVLFTVLVGMAAGILDSAFDLQPRFETGEIDVTATEIEVLWRTAKEDGPTADGALLDGAYFFGSLERLRSVRVAEDRGATNH